MNFDFSDEQYMFRDATRGILEANYDLNRARQTLSGEGFDAGLWSKLVETGIFAMLVPEMYGGLGQTLIDLSLVLEEYGRALIPSPVPETLAAIDLISRFGTEDQKSRLLPQLAEGRVKIAPAILEVEAGYDPDDLGVTASTTGDGWRVSGRKILVPQAASADYLLVALRFGTRGSVGLVLVERDRKGVSISQHETIDLLNRHHSVVLSDVVISKDDVIGGDLGVQALTRLLDTSGMIAATLMVGVAGKVLDNSVEYAKQREQFGKPIGSFQAIKHRCADMAVALDASRSAAYYAAWAVAEDAPDRARAVSMAKSACGEAARFVCNEGIQIHGGMGFTWELGLHFYLRRARTLEFSYGDVAYHRERVLAETMAELGLRAGVA